MSEPGNVGQYENDSSIKLTVGGANSQYQQTSTAMRTVRDLEESRPETKPPRGKKNVHGYVEMTHHEKK
jgi:hypothetical protein